MTLTLTTVPCLDDNYAFIIGTPATKEVAVIDIQMRTNTSGLCVSVFTQSRSGMVYASSM